LIDLKLPDIKGEDLLKQLNATKPEMKKIVLTGNAVTGEKPKRFPATPTLS
jgi:FixJ family two-component response regulator